MDGSSKDEDTDHLDPDSKKIKLERGRPHLESAEKMSLGPVLAVPVTLQRPSQTHSQTQQSQTQRHIKTGSDSECDVLLLTDTGTATSPGKESNSTSCRFSLTKPSEAESAFGPRSGPECDQGQACYDHAAVASVDTTTTQPSTSSCASGNADSDSLTTATRPTGISHLHEHDDKSRIQRESTRKFVHTPAAHSETVAGSRLSRASLPSELPEPLPGRCHFYVERKRRHCKAPQPNGRIYCIEHSHLLGDQSVKKRIQCPLDPKHSCYEDQLQKHLKKCNASKGLKEVYYEENINSGSDDGEHQGYKVGIRDVDEKIVLALVEKVQQVYKEHVPEIATEVLFHPVLQEMTDKPDNGPSAQKHIRQQASLLGHMEKLGLLKDQTNYIEFGAGKGGLSHWVQLAVKNCTETGFILIDRGSVRYKMDNYHKGVDQGPSFERLKIDIQHLHLGKVKSLQNSCRSLVATGKHLCGAATDLMLRCLMGREAAERNQDSPLKGLVLAFCCHHRCDWKSYVGKDFMRQCGFTASDFHLMCSMSSWATCGTRPVRPTAEQRGEEACDTAAAEYNHPRYGGLVPQERERIGNQCKQLIDQGRIHYLHSHSLEAKMAYYIDKSLTLENVVLLAHATDASQ